MKVIKIAPRGYCSGVINALNIVGEATYNKDLPRPIYILGMIVHNEHITKAIANLNIITLENQGKSRLELLDEIDSGTVIFTAHGISPAVRAKAQAKGLTCVDASCKDVIKTHVIMKEYLAAGYDILYIGKKGHPETEGSIGIDPKHIHLISSGTDLERLKIGNSKIMITNQTTMSLWDVGSLATAIQAKFPQAEFIKEVCNATQIRQEAVAKLAKEADLTIVVGDPQSNNTARLAQISEELAKTPAHRIGSLEELNLDWLKGIQAVAVTSGASTPTVITKEVIDFLEAFDEQRPETWDTTSNISLDKIFKTKH